MDKKKWMTLALLGILLAWVILLNLPQKNNFELDINADSFALEHSNEVDSITFDYEGKILSMSKFGGDWLINGKVKAEKSLVERMLNMTSQIKLKRAWNTEKTDSSASYVGITFFKSGQKLLGFMLKKEGLSVMKTSENSKSYLAEIPGFSDSFGSYFTANELTWKSNLIFNSTLRTLNELEIINHKDPKFNLKANYKDGFFDFKGLALPDTQKVGLFLSQFREVRYDYGLNDSLKVLSRKLLSVQKPLLSIEVVDIDSTKNNFLTIYELKENKRFYLGTTKVVSDTFLISKKTITNLTPSLNQLSKTTP
ncbi:MAG: hypothetical protein SNJ77_10630 [Cytophagales bacterium]